MCTNYLALLCVFVLDLFPGSSRQQLPDRLSRLQRPTRRVLTVHLDYIHVYRTFSKCLQCQKEKKRRSAVMHWVSGVHLGEGARWKTRMWIHSSAANQEDEQHASWKLQYRCVNSISVSFINLETWLNCVKKIEDIKRGRHPPPFKQRSKVTGSWGAAIFPPANMLDAKKARSGGRCWALVFIRCLSSVCLFCRMR